MNIYDFDETIYDSDSTKDFYFYCLNKYPKILFSVPMMAWTFFLYIFGVKTKTQFKEKMYRFLTALWGVLSAGILLFGYVAGARSRHITMNGPVHILLEEEEEQTENIEVKPGEQIEKSAWVTVEKSEAKVQVRVKVLADGIMAPQQRDLLENIQMNENWFYCEKDGYFYCAEKLCEGKKVHFQAKITVPPKWKEWTEDLQFRLELAADGV